MEQANNQAGDIVAPAINNQAIVEVVEIPQPKVTPHLSEMVEQHAKIREARMANLVNQTQKDRMKIEQLKIEEESIIGEQSFDTAVEATESENISPKNSNTQDLSNRAEKRIGKLTARAKSAEEQLDARDKSIAELRSEVEKLKNPGITAQNTPTKSQPIPEYLREVSVEEEKNWGEYARETDPSKLQQEYKKIKNFRDEISDTLDVGDVKTDPTSGKEYLMEINGAKYTKQELVAIRRDLNKRVEDAIPSRMNAIREVQTYKQRADSFIPQWVPEAIDKNSDVYAELQQIKNSRYGWVLNEAPQAELYIAAGIKAVKEQLAKGQKPNVTSMVPSKPIKVNPPRANIPTNAGPAMTSSDISSEAKSEYERLKHRAQITQSESDMAVAMSYKKQNKL